MSRQPVAVSAERAAYDALCAYTLTLADPDFIHQHIVDTFAAQAATVATRPITLAMSLVGLYLAIERGYSGRKVQHIHTLLARNGRRIWPVFTLPDERGEIRVGDVMAAPAGDERDAAILRWCTSVWTAFAVNRSVVEELLRTSLPD